MNPVKALIFIGLAFLAGGITQADQAADESAIRKALGEMTPSSITPTPVPGLYEVVVGRHLVYMSADGRYMLQGELVDVQKRESLTEPRRREIQLAAVESVSEDNMIIFEPEKVKHTITVFTDIDCGYCRQLHGEMDQLLDAGIRVRYMMFPRAGVGSMSYKKAVAVWCAEDRNSALTDSKNGKSIDMKTCDNPINQHMQLVEELGVRGTPYLVFENGQNQPGYVPAKRLIRVLDQSVTK